jgi:tetratricopeptide (TPR) repeat protein
VRYAAFISYNHRDRKIASWLHRALETYKVPKQLIGQDGPAGSIGARLPPIFQDREELAASSDLAASVREALSQSASLIVICSPHGAASRWVNEEIREFTRLGHRDRLQCLIVGGDPHASTRPGADPTQECLPPALFEDGASEPLAPDIRPGQDDRNAAKLKLLAGLLGVSFDELRQREQARRQRQLAVAAAVSGSGFLIMAGLAGFALASRNEAVHQRDIARQKTLTAERTVAFVKSLFEVADPSETRGDTISAGEILDRGARQLDQGLGDEPTVKAELFTTLGEVYGGLGKLHKSEAVLRQALDLKGVDAATRARQLTALGEAQWRSGDYHGALASEGKAMALLPEAGAAASSLRPRLLLALGGAHTRLADHEAARREINQALLLDLGTADIPATQIALDHERLGLANFYANELPAARREIEQGLSIRLKLQGPTHPLVADDLNTIGTIELFEGDISAAERDYRRALKGYEATLGPDHPYVASGLNNLARAFLERRAFAEAEPLERRALAINLAQKSDTADDLVFEYTNLGISLRGQGRLPEAEAAFAKAQPIAALHKHRNLAPIMVERAEIACGTGALARGLALTQDARPIMAAAYRKDPWRIAWVDAVRGDCLTRAGKTRDGRELLVAAAPAIKARWPASTLYGARLEAMLHRAGL